MLFYMKMVLGIIFISTLWLSTTATGNDTDLSAIQMLVFKNRTKGPIGTLTTNSGCPVNDIDTDVTINRSLIRNEYFMDSMTQLLSERIPERIVHANGAGATGYFEVTHNLKDICKAKVFSKDGKKTPIAVRFSTTIIGRAGIDTTRDARGFAVKFYTEEGNFDLTGINIPVFHIKDPIYFPSFVHAFNANPSSNVQDFNTQWDFITSRPESLHNFLHVFSDLGIPKSYSLLDGWGVHTFQVRNADGKISFLRFFYPADIRAPNFLTSQEQAVIGGSDPNYETRTLYNDIAKGKKPSWTLFVQVLSINDVKNATFDVFDVTRLLPIDKYPLREVGKFYLDKNPENFFEEIEQIAFCPHNLVPGIDGAPDKLFEARSFAYRDAQKYRLGINFPKIPVNCPLKTKVLTYNRGGVPPVGKNGAGPSYFPNSFNGPSPVKDPYHKDVIAITESKPQNFDQDRVFIQNQRDQKNGAYGRLTQNIADSLRNAAPFLQDRALKMLSEIDKDCAHQVSVKLKCTKGYN